jgi:hypothetical protein
LAFTLWPLDAGAASYPPIVTSIHQRDFERTNSIGCTAKPSIGTGWPRQHEGRDRTPTPLAGDALVVIDSSQER